MGLGIAGSEHAAWGNHSYDLSCFPSPPWNNSLSACVLSDFSRVWLFVTPWTVAHQAPVSMGFSRQEYWSGLPCPPPGDLPDPELNQQPSVSYTSKRFFLLFVFVCLFFNHWSHLGSAILNSNINLTTYWLCTLSLNYLSDTKSVFVSIKWRYRIVHSCQILKILWICRTILLLYGSLYQPMYFLLHKLRWVLRTFQGISTRIL